MSGPPPPWAAPASQVAETHETSADTGLTTDETAARLERFGPNQLTSAAQVPAWRKFLRQFADPLVYLLIGAIGVSFLAWLLEGAQGAPIEVIVIGTIIILNAVLGYVQESRADQAVAALARMGATMATVVRDGEQTRVPAADLVPGDVLLLAEGDAVGADGRLLEAASLTIAEASLTGESEPVVKQTEPIDADVGIGDRTNMVFSGTAVTRGRGRAIVTATGRDTEMGNVASLLEEVSDQETPLEREVGRIGRLLGIAVIVIAVIVIGTIWLTSDVDSAADLIDILIIGVSLAVAAVPEGLPAILSVVLALGVQRMADHHAIVKQLSSVETLGSASVVCTDKTGTLTRNEMTIERVVTGSADIAVTGTGYQPEGELRSDDDALDDPAILEEVAYVLGGGSLANDAHLDEHDGVWSIQGDPTEAAFLVAEAKIDGLPELRRDRFERVGEVPFTSERKLMSTINIDAEHEGTIAVVAKGAPDVLLARCTQERVGGEERPLDDRRRAEILDVVDGLADAALRTIAVAYKEVPEGLRDDPDDVERDLCYLGMVGIIDPPRDEARAAIAEAHGAGIRVVMITGDHPRTAVRIAADLGIVDTGVESDVVTGVALDGMDDDALREASRHTSVYARVSPEHKLRIVDALQSNGSIVSMTGDGVNDAPALKRADIGVAMGITGTDVSKEAADVILTDDNFATIITAVREGRAILSNIRKFLRFLLSSNIGEVLTMFLGVVLAGVIGLSGEGSIAVPLLATQILWINLLTDSGPALAMGLDPPPDDVMRRPPRRPTDRIIDAEMWFGIMFVGMVMAIVSLAAFDLGAAGGLFGGTGTVSEGRTMAFTTLVLAQLFNAVNARSDRVSAFRHLFTNRWLWAAIALSLVLQVMVVHLPPLQHAFDTTPLSLGEWGICVGLASIVLWADELKKLVERAVQRPGRPR